MSEPGGEIDWKPLVPGGHGVVTHRLVPVSCGFEMRRSTGMASFAGLGIVPGAAFIGLGVVAMLTRPSLWTVFTIALGIAFVGAGLAFVWPRSVRFNATSKQVEKGPDRVPFDWIAGLQVLRESISHDERIVDSYELNLVLKDGSRLNVVDHAGGTQLREEAARLGALIGCPVFDQPPA